MNEIMSRLTRRGVAHETTAPTLSVENVSVAYTAGSQDAAAARGDQYALHDVTFQVEQGKRVAIVGPNGAGKSTLFKLIVGALSPVSGRINIFGHGPDGHICIGYVPQRSQIDWTFPVTVEDVVMMGRVGQIGFFHWPRRRDWQIVHQSLERVNADHLAHKQIGELSGGQQQRVFVARALAQEAELLLLDEPLAGLDMPSQEGIFDILDNLRPEGVTILVATHDLNLAAARFDEVMLLNREIVAYGPPSAVLTTENLFQAYGGRVHRLAADENGVYLTDTCCEGQGG
jgi:manganese/iron transport system ATP-binding protein